MPKTFSDLASSSEGIRRAERLLSANFITTSSQLRFESISMMWVDLKPIWRSLPSYWQLIFSCAAISKPRS